MKRSLILTFLLLFSCSLFSQKQLSKVNSFIRPIPSSRIDNIKQFIRSSSLQIHPVAYWEIVKRYNPADFIVPSVAQSRPSQSVPASDISSSKLKTLLESIKQKQTIEPSVIPHSHTAHDHYNSADISSPSIAQSSPPQSIPSHNISSFSKLKALSEYIAPKVLGFEPTPLMPLRGLSKFKNLRDEIKLCDFAENNDDCLEDPFFDPNISPDAITIVKKEQDYLVNNKPSDNPCDDLVDILSQKEVSTFVEILFENVTDYNSILDLDKIEQNTNLDIKHCVASYYHNGYILVQIPIMSKSLMNPFLKFWEYLKSRFSHSTKKGINKSKSDENKNDFIEKEFEGLRYLENNIINEYYDCFLEEQTVA